MEQEFKISPLEATSYFLGILTVCAMAESRVLDGTWHVGEWGVLKRGFLGITEKLNLDEFLKALDPAEPLFRRTTRERSRSDPKSFSTTLTRLTAIRRQRGVKIHPYRVPPDKEAEGRVDYSGLENYSRLAGLFSALVVCERLVHVGAMPSASMGELIATPLDDGVVRLMTVFLDRLGAKDAVLPGVKTGDVEATREALIRRMGAGERVFEDLDNRFFLGHEKVFPALALRFVEDFLDKYTADDARFQVQQILFTLHKRLQARREAVERYEYDHLEKIDENCKHLFATLEQYGIKATNYEEAQQAYDRRYRTTEPPKEVPPESVREQLRKRMRTRIDDVVGLRKDCEAAVKDYPEWERFIRWEYQKEIDRLGGGR